MSALANWSLRRWSAGGAGAIVTALLIGLPTDVIPNPVFGRTVDVTWWSYPVLVATSVLGGLLLATYVADPDHPSTDDELDRSATTGGVGGLLSFFAVGCPTCNKLVVVALGTSGALDWFAPAQPLVAVASLAMLGWALRTRLRGPAVCRVAV